MELPSMCLNVFLLVASALVGLYVYFTWTFSYWARRGVPALPPVPALGNFARWALLRSDIGSMFRELYNKGKHHKVDLVGIWVFRRPSLMAMSPEMIKLLLVKDFGHFADRSTHADRNYDPLGSDNLFFGKNPHWKFMRIKLTHLFSSAKMKLMFGLMNEIGDDLEVCIREHGERPVEMKETAAKFTTDVIATTAYGLKANTLADDTAPFNLFRKKLLDFRWLRAIEFMSIFFLQSLAKLWKSCVFEKECADWLRRVFWGAVQERERTQEVRSDLIGTLISLKDQTKEGDSIKFSGDSLVAQAAVFFTAGNESSSTTISFLLYQLALNPNIQEKLATEIITTLAKHDGNITYEGLHEMQYLEMCVFETLRMFPPLPFLDRECTKTYRVPGSGLVIEKGTIVYVPLMGIHSDERYFPEPYVFRPERFDKNGGSPIQPFTFLPFGEGPRNCIGERYGMLQTRLAIIHVLRRYQVQRCSQTQEPLKWQTLALSPTSRDGIYLRCVLRASE